MSTLRLEHDDSTLELDPEDSPVVVARIDEPPQGKRLGGVWEHLGMCRFLRQSPTTEAKNLLIYEEGTWRLRPAYEVGEKVVRPIDFMVGQEANFALDSSIEATSLSSNEPKVVLNAIAGEQGHTTRIINGDQENVMTIEPGKVMPSEVDVGDKLEVERPSDDELVIRVLEDGSST